MSVDRILVGAFPYRDQGPDSGSAYVLGFTRKDLNSDGLCDSFFAPFDGFGFVEPGETHILALP